MQILLRRLFQFISCVVVFCEREAYDDVHVRSRIFAVFSAKRLVYAREWIHNESIMRSTL